MWVRGIEVVVVSAHGWCELVGRLGIPSRTIEVISGCEDGQMLAFVLVIDLLQGMGIAKQV